MSTNKSRGVNAQYFHSVKILAIWLFFSTVSQANDLCISFYNKTDVAQKKTRPLTAEPIDINKITNGLIFSLEHSDVLVGVTAENLLRSIKAKRGYSRISNLKRTSIEDLLEQNREFTDYLDIAAKAEASILDLINKLKEGKVPLMKSKEKFEDEIIAEIKLIEREAKNSLDASGNIDLKIKTAQRNLAAAKLKARLEIKEREGYLIQLVDINTELVDKTLRRPDLALKTGILSQILGVEQSREALAIQGDESYSQRIDQENERLTILKKDIARLRNLSLTELASSAGLGERLVSKITAYNSVSKPTSKEKKWSILPKSQPSVTLQYIPDSAFTSIFKLRPDIERIRDHYSSKLLQLNITPASLLANINGHQTHAVRSPEEVLYILTSALPFLVDNYLGSNFRSTSNLRAGILNLIDGGLNVNLAREFTRGEWMDFLVASDALKSAIASIKSYSETAKMPVDSINVGKGLEGSNRDAYANWDKMLTLRLERMKNKFFSEANVNRTLVADSRDVLILAESYARQELREIRSIIERPVVFTLVERFLEKNEIDNNDFNFICNLLIAHGPGETTSIRSQVEFVDDSGVSIQSQLPKVDLRIYLLKLASSKLRLQKINKIELEIMSGAIDRIFSETKMVGELNRPHYFAIVWYPILNRLEKDLKADLHERSIKMGLPNPQD